MSQIKLRWYLKLKGLQFNQKQRKIIESIPILEEL
jgi:hypothetical protein